MSIEDQEAWKFRPKVSRHTDHPSMERSEMEVHKNTIWSTADTNDTYPHVIYDRTTTNTKEGTSFVASDTVYSLTDAPRDP